MYFFSIEALQLLKLSPSLMSEFALILSATVFALNLVIPGNDIFCIIQPHTLNQLLYVDQENGP